jgi:hypothetical protein
MNFTLTQVLNVLDEIENDLTKFIKDAIVRHRERDTDDSLLAQSALWDILGLVHSKLDSMTCHVMTAKPQPTINWVDGNEPDLDDEPGYDLEHRYTDEEKAMPGDCSECSFFVDECREHNFDKKECARTQYEDLLNCKCTNGFMRKSCYRLLKNKECYDRLNELKP